MTLYQGDSAWILNLVPSESVDLVVTSPPYDNLREYKGYSFNFEGIAEQLVRVLAPGGVIVWVVGDATVKGSESGTSFHQALHFKQLGLNLHDTMIYSSDKPPLTHNRYEQKFEFMFVFSKGKPSRFNPILETCKNAGKNNPKRTFRHSGDDTCLMHNTSGTIVKDNKIKGNIWHYLTGSLEGSKEQFKHPATFPIQLATDHIISWSNAGDTVLDPFLGSGTTGVACANTGRKFIGIETSYEYFKIASDRIELAKAIKWAERLQA